MICHRSKYLRILYIIWQGQEKKKVYRSKLTGQVGKNSHKGTKTQTMNGSRSRVQGSTFRVKDKEGPTSSFKILISQIIANLTPNFGLVLTKLTLLL